MDAIKHSPLPIWLESMTRNYLRTKQIIYHDLLDGMRLKFPGQKENIYTFNIRESVNNPIPEPLSLQHEIVQTILKDAIPFTANQQIPRVKIKNGASTSGHWSLWHLEVKNQFETHQIIQPVFISKEGDSFPAYAQNIWDKIIQENDYFNCVGVLPEEESRSTFKNISGKAEELLQTKYSELERSIILNSERVKANKERSFIFQEKQMNRIGIENIKNSRLARLSRERETWDTTFESASQIVPSLSCLLMVNIVNE